jgi:Reverse transcriptase (RNA-dependent DNA polymerase)
VSSSTCLLFYKNELDLWMVNQATIILIAKKQGDCQLDHYRSISIIQCLIKIISKMLATRLKPHMTQMVHGNQTTFINNRSIMETFLMAWESIHVRHKYKIPLVAFKIDFAKAFDSVSCYFILTLLIQRRFPTAWVQWMKNLFISSSSSLSINGIPSQPFFHRRGLKQGDPLTPLIFVLVTDVLQRILQHSRSELLTLPIVQTTAL